MPPVQRLAAFSLAVAAATILVLAYFVVTDLAREADLLRAASAAQYVKDHLETLRLELNEVRGAARLAAFTGDAEALKAIEARAARIDAELVLLRARAAEDATVPSFEGLARTARLLVVHAQSIAALRRDRGTEAALVAARQAEQLAMEATTALESALGEQTRRIDERSAARLKVGRSLRTYVAWFVFGSIAVLGWLFVVLQRVQRRERKAQKRVEWLAHFDLVTGLPNRALLADRLAQETARAVRNAGRFAVLIFDLDGFKGVNDTWGHPAGDRVLAMVAERARKCMRASDTVGRLGGDEFLAILPDTSEDGAVEVADKLREALQAPYPLGDAQARVGASVGVGVFPEHGSDPQGLQRAADAALYAAKREGRNRTRVALAVAAAASSTRETDTPETAVR